MSHMHISSIPENITVSSAGLVRFNNCRCPDPFDS